MPLALSSLTGSSTFTRSSARLFFLIVTAGDSLYFRYVKIIAMLFNYRYSANQNRVTYNLFSLLAGWLKA
jgi:hypothetical protein